MHIAGQEIFFPAGPGGVVAYPMGLIANLLMFFGIFLASKVIGLEENSRKQFSEKRITVYFTSFAAIFRGGFMPIIDYAILYNFLLPLIIGTTIPEAYILSLLPSFILYNVTSTLYAVPVAHLIARRVNKSLKLETHLLI